MGQTRVWLIGLGTVGRWLLRAFADRQAGARFVVIGAGNARDGFIHDPDGLDPLELLSLLEAGRPIGGLGARDAWPSAIDGMRATEADVLADVADSPNADGAAGAERMHEALARGVPVATSNKWPVAQHGVALSALAAEAGTSLRAESTVMSATPLLGPITTGLAGAEPLAARGVLNATANAIVSRMAAGEPYPDALAAAQREGLAEPDPSSDVDGWDSAAKVMVLSALVFGRQLAVDDVSREGIGELRADELQRVARTGGRVRLVESLELSEPGGGGEVTASVAPMALAPDDPLTAVDGADCALTLTAEPLGELMIRGPGAGPRIAGLGVLNDLLALAKN
jgi:homoserine dehydrogenase